tara:strand:- start:51 stop:944 length:894 start_codon:yes stop_codon:yes gene_type:complete
MGYFPRNQGFISMALPLTSVGGAGVANIADVPVATSAWLFENQTGTLGTNLSGSTIYIGAVPAGAGTPIITGTVSVIPTGTVGVQSAVTAITPVPLTSGSGYVEANAVDTTVVTAVPNSPATVPAGLKVNITVPVPTTKASTPGTGYPTGGFTVTGGTGTGLNGVIETVTGGGATGPINTFAISDGGKGYSEDDVLTIVAGDGIGGSMTLATAPNGAITVIAINAPGANYSVGDIITVDQAGSELNATFSIAKVANLLPTLLDAIVFNNVVPGTVLPVMVDYVTATNTSATLLLACK